jgi:hypothetical protein
MKGNGEARSGRASFRAAIVILVVTGAACHDSPTPTEPGPRPTPTPIPAPIAIEGHIEGGPTYGGGDRLTMDVCGCTSGILEVIDGDRPPEPISCSGQRYLYGAPTSGASTRFPITVRSAAWSVTKEFTVPIDPHLGLQARAYCLPGAASALRGGR